ncbi:hypothetical protein [Sphingomonas sp.]|uniref:hypothetical protein n=1 Tax=Sphingomonas sp. TaxID=28214 RepID=UPI00286B088B|nr:hypothetical protein [Sphingomonas sp.]
MRFDRVGSICLATLLLAACGKGEVYDRPLDQVRDLLRTVEMPMYVFGSSADTDAIIDSSDPARIVWKIKANGSNVMKVIATIEPEGEARTRVNVEIEGSNEGKYGDVEGRFKQLPGLKNMYLVTMKEAVDSTLDGRRFDITVTYPAMMAATMANAKQLFPKSHSEHR